MASRRVQCIFCQHSFVLAASVPPQDCPGCGAELPDDTYIIDLGPISSALDRNPTEEETSYVIVAEAPPRAPATESTESAVLFVTDGAHDALSDAHTADRLVVASDPAVANVATSAHLHVAGLQDVHTRPTPLAIEVTMDRLPPPRNAASGRCLDGDLEAGFYDFDDETKDVPRREPSSEAPLLDSADDEASRFDEDTVSSNLDLDALASAVEASYDETPKRWRCHECLAEFPGTAPSICPACGSTLKLVFARKGR